jgi:putative ABC transport system permease protein
MRLSGFAWHNLARRRTRTVLTMLAIALAVGTVVALIALSRGITDGVARSVDERGAEFLVQPRSSADIMSARIAEPVGAQIAAIAGVASVSGELYAATISAERHVFASGWSAASPGWALIPVAAGRVPEPGEKAVILGDVLAEALGMTVGDTVELFDDDFTVVGISRYATAMNRSLAIMPLETLQAAALRPGQVSMFLVRLDPDLGPAARDRVRSEISAQLPVIVSESREILDQDANLAVFVAVSRAVSVIAFAMGALSLFATLLNMVQERTREIGILLAIGWSDRHIVSLIMIEGAIIGGAGCVLGVLLGISASALFTAIPMIGSFVSLTPRAADLALPLVLALPICVLGSAYPALRAVRLRPAEALRSL